MFNFFVFKENFFFKISDPIWGSEDRGGHRPPWKGQEHINIYFFLIFSEHVQYVQKLHVELFFVFFCYLSHIYLLVLL